jgi:hypothetical protein
MTQEEFYHRLYGIAHSAFRWEAQPAYALGYERENFARFLAGSPVPPPEIEWWRPWLTRIAQMTAEGKLFSRVRVLDEPTNDYQRWMIWTGQWNVEAGEHIGYMTRSKTRQLSLSGTYDWWLLDDERLIIMRYSASGEIADKEMITEPGAIARHRDWRDLAVLNAAQAGEILAA